MNTPAYVEAAEELRSNAEQWQAYESEGNCVVLAGPGSGKTKVITIKIARLLSETVRKPQRLACITFSNACVGELKSRLQKLGVAEDERLLLSTVHSFCLSELVAPYARLAGLAVPDPIVVASPSRSREVFTEAYAQTLGGKPPRWYRTEFDRLRRTVLDRGSKEWKEWQGRETEVVEAYETLLAQEGLVDFDGLILTGLRLVEDHQWVRECVRAKYPVVVIDEYQDLGVPLHRMVLGLMKTGIRVVAVGDPDQSIYGFTGAKPALLRKLAGLPGVESIELRLNYRCADQIIAASKTLLENPADFQSHDGRQGEIRIYGVKQDVRGQADYALGTVLPALLKANKDWTPGDVAVLYRSFNEGTAVADAADALDLRYFRVDNGSPIKRSRLIEWLTDAARWCAGGWHSGDVSLSQLLKSWRIFRPSVMKPVEALAIRARLISTLFANRDGSIPLVTWLAALNAAVLGDAFENEPSLADEEDTFDDLLKACAQDGPLQAYTIEIFGNQGRSPEQINFMTLHSSKGLEFEAVIMIGLEGGTFPSRYDDTKEKLEEASRLFYVGVTRAKSMIHLMYGFNESPFISRIRQATQPD
jgi:ATP-dependent DNA helicase Rep/DNA helicase-2/ATP-dependent DNA helicase PcrA